MFIKIAPLVLALFLVAGHATSTANKTISQHGTLARGEGNGKKLIRRARQRSMIGADGFIEKDEAEKTNEDASNSLADTLARLEGGNATGLAGRFEDMLGKNKHGPNADLLLSLPIVLQNLTNYSGLIKVSQGSHKLEEGVSHSFGNIDSDESLLFDNVNGFFTVLHKSLKDTNDKTPDADSYCPFNNVSVIKRCLELALCLVQGGVQGGFPSIQMYSLLEELQCGFQEIGWDNIISSLEQENEKSETTISDDYLPSGHYSCDATSDWMQTNGSATLLQTNGKEKKTDSSFLAVAYRTSAALLDAAKTTHAVLDSWTHNASVDATLAALHRALAPACKLLNCDHTNYYDLYGASHSHSLALIDAGASAQHMRVHIRSRFRLEKRMQRFLGEHGVLFMEKMYRTEGTTTEAQSQYVSLGRVALMSFVAEYPQTQGVNDIWLDLLNRERMKVFFERRGKAHLLDSLWDSRHTDSLGGRQGGFPTEGDGPSQAGMAPHRGRWLLTGREGRRSGKGFGKKLKKIAKKAGKATTDFANDVANGVAAAVEFIIDMFACIGELKFMTAVGYCKKFPEGGIVGVGVSLSASVAGPLLNLMKGDQPGSITVKLGAVFGSVPGTPVTGGLRSGVGVGANVGCSSDSCKVGIAVGNVNSALVPYEGSRCVGGSWLGDFKCMIGAGQTVTLLCCDFNLVTGNEDCR